MTFDIAILLGQDGITNGTIYALIALAVVLVYTVSRVIFFPQGDFVVYGALTLAVLEGGKVPGTVWLVVTLGAMALVLDTFVALRSRKFGSLPHSALINLAIPVVVAGLAWWLAPLKPPLILRMALTILIMLPLGPLIYRLAFQPIAHASSLVLLIIAVAVHFALDSLGLAIFGTEGYRTKALPDARFGLGVLTISAQSVGVTVVSLALMVSLYAFFTYTIAGKALRATAVNRLGARLMAISPNNAGAQSFALAAAIGAVSGILISPITTIYYDSGLLISFKGLVGAVVAGLTSYPMAVCAALGVGLLESFSSFWSSEYQEIIVFMMVIPVLLIRSVLSAHHEEEE